MLKVFENLETRVKSIYNVVVLTAIRWKKMEGSNCPAEVTKKSFKHYLKQNWQDVAYLNSEETEKNTIAQMARDAGFCIEDLTIKVAYISDGDGDKENGNENEDEEVPGLQAQRSCLTLACVLLQRNSNLTEESSRALFQCRKALRLVKQDKMSQATIIDHFVKK